MNDLYTVTIILIALALLLSGLCLYFYRKSKAITIDMLCSTLIQKDLSILPAPVIIRNCKEKKENASPSLWALFSISPTESESIKIRDLFMNFTSESREKLQQYILKMRTEHTPFQTHVQWENKQEHTAPSLMIFASCFTDSHHNILYEFYWFHPLLETPFDQQNTALRKQEQILQQEMREMKTFYQTLIDHLPVAVQVSDQNGSSLLENQLAKQMPSTVIPSAYTLPYGLKLHIAEKKAPSIKENNLHHVHESLPIAFVSFDHNQNLLAYSQKFLDTFPDFPERWLHTGLPFVRFLAILRDARALPEVMDFEAFRAQKSLQFHNLKQPEETSLQLPDSRTIRQVTIPLPESGLLFTWEDESEKLFLQRSLKTQHTVQRQTFDHLHEGIACFNSGGILRFFNPAFIQMWSFDQQRPFDENLHVKTFFDMLETRIVNTESQLKKLQELSQNIMQRYHIKETLYGQNGHVIACSTVSLSDGSFILSCLDITDSARVEASLRRETQVLERANKLQSGFIQDISREIRTPMTTIIGLSDMLLTHYFGELNKRQKDYCSKIQSSAETIMKTVAERLDIAAFNAHETTLHTENIPVFDALVQTFPLLRERMEQKNITLSLNEDNDNIAIVDADIKKLKQLFFTILIYSIDTSVTGSQISLVFTYNNHAMTLSIADTGVPLDISLAGTLPNELIFAQKLAELQQINLVILPKNVLEMKFNVHLF